MPFLQLSFECRSIDPESVEAAGFAAGALAVTLSDAADTPVLEPLPGETPLWPQVRATLLFDAGANRSAIVQALEGELGTALPDAAFDELADRVWEREWMADFHAMSFGDRLWICPHGQELERDGAVIVHLDPGLAFGTGTHQTTAMCLRWLDGARLENKEVIDFGCGSGVLAIAAAKLGARRVWAVDHDPQALIATRENAAVNEVADRVHALAPAELAAKPSTPSTVNIKPLSREDETSATCDLILANILAQPLIDLAPRFRELLRQGGEVVLSGILRQQADAVLAAYQEGFDMSEPTFQDEWACLHGVRR